VICAYPRPLDGKHIVITGASTGIGRASADIMAAQGARVLVVARRENLLQQAVADIRAAGGTADYAVADVADKAALMATFDKAEAVFGPIDGLFANAGIGGQVVPLTDYDDDALDEILTVNFKSLFWSMKRVLPGMIARKSGAIVATGSLASERGLPMTAGYNASKHAVLGLVRSAAVEVARHNVRVNCVIPGLIETPMLAGIAGELSGGDVQAGLTGMGAMVPQGRIGQPGELGNVAAFLLSDGAAYVNGQAWSVDGGILGTMMTGG
jgi:NAD(P)-dependent dehydrogenase (short-subunit alcohol dehydrogenase family)